MPLQGSPRDDRDRSARNHPVYLVWKHALVLHFSPMTENGWLVSTTLYEGRREDGWTNATVYMEITGQTRRGATDRALEFGGDASFGLDQKPTPYSMGLPASSFGGPLLGP